MAFKKIRDLGAFSSSEPFSVDDELAVSDKDKSSTKKISAKELVSAVNIQNAEEAKAAADTVTDSSGNTVNNPTKSTTEILDPATGEIIDATPVTASNLDTLVDPGSGLEVVEVCRDANFNIVSCSASNVKYRTKKLSLAKSNDALTITIKIDATDPNSIFYANGIGIDSSNNVNAVFKRLRDAYRWIRENVVDVNTVVSIGIFSDIEEGEINSNETYFTSKGHQTPGCKVYVTGYDKASGTNSITAKKEPIKIYMRSKSRTTGSFGLQWHTASLIQYFNIHFVWDLTSSAGMHMCSRIGEGRLLMYYNCKFTMCGSAHIVFEASRGGHIEFQNYTDGEYNNYALSYDKADYLGRGYPCPAIEFDFVGKNGASGNAFYCNYFISADTSASVRMPEYGPYTLNHGISGPYQTFLNRFHFCSNKFTIGSNRSFVSLEGACTLDMHANFTRSSGVTMSSTQFPAWLTASGFNTVALRDGTHPDGTNYTNYPGNTLHATDSSGQELNQYGAVAVKNVDYRMTTTLNPTVNLESTARWYARNSTTNNKILQVRNLGSYYGSIPSSNGNYK